MELPAALGAALTVMGLLRRAPLPAHAIVAFALAAAARPLEPLLAGGWTLTALAVIVALAGAAAGLLLSGIRALRRELSGR
jgi:NaMN:DMB phosphoribosyltransferase